MGKADLKLDWCDAKAARYACERWHYSGCMPVFKTSKVGVWERGEFIGAIIFGNPMPPVVKRLGMSNTEVAELMRVALREHETPVSRMIRVAVLLLRKANPGLRVLVSFADPGQGHHGGIYQAGGWVYTGSLVGGTEWMYKGEWVHPRTIVSAISSGALSKGAWKHLQKRDTAAKHRYILPLDPSVRSWVESQRKPYPKRARSDTSDTLAVQAGKGGAAPTLALSHCEVVS